MPSADGREGSRAPVPPGGPETVLGHLYARWGSPSEVALLLGILGLVTALVVYSLPIRSRWESGIWPRHYYTDVGEAIQRLQVEIPPIDGMQEDEFEREMEGAIGGLMDRAHRLAQREHPRTPDAPDYGLHHDVVFQSLGVYLALLGVGVLSVVWAAIRDRAGRRRVLFAALAWLVSGSLMLGDPFGFVNWILD